MEIRKWVAPGC